MLLENTPSTLFLYSSRRFDTWIVNIYWLIQILFWTWKFELLIFHEMKINRGKQMKKCEHVSSNQWAPFDTFICNIYIYIYIWLIYDYDIECTAILWPIDSFLIRFLIMKYNFFFGFLQPTFLGTNFFVPDFSNFVIFHFFISLIVSFFVVFCAFEHVLICETAKIKCTTVKNPTLIWEIFL